MKVLAPITQDQDAVSKAYVDGLLADYAKSESLGALASQDSLSFSDLTAKPATLSGYGINDAVYFVGTMNDPNTAYFRHVGYGYGEGGWHGAGPAFGFGANGTYYARIQALNSPDTPYLFFQSNSGGVAGKWFRFLFAEGNDNIESGRFSCKGDIVLHRNEDAGDTFLNYGPYANDGASLFLYGKNVGIVCTENFTVNGAEVIASNTIANHTAGKANQLATARKLWGQLFDGSKDIAGTLSDVGVLNGNKITDPVNTNVGYQWRLIPSGDTLYIQAGTAAGDTSGSLYLTGYTGQAANLVRIHAGTTTITGALTVDGTAVFNGAVYNRQLCVFQSSVSIESTLIMNGQNISGLNSVYGATPAGALYPRWVMFNNSGGLFFQAASYDGTSEAGRLQFTGYNSKAAEQVRFFAADIIFDGKAKFYGEISVDGHVKTNGQIVGTHNGGEYERFSIKQNTVGTFFQAGVNDGSKQQGILYLAGINNTMMEALHVRSDNMLIYGSVSVPYAPLTLGSTMSVAGSATFLGGLKIANGQAVRFEDAEGKAHSIAYDNTRRAFMVDGEIYPAGGGGSSSTNVPLLKEWEDFDRETMEGYGLGAALGYDLFSLVENLDTLLSEVNGTMTNDPFVIPNEAIAYGVFNARAGIKTTYINADSFVASDSVIVGNTVRIGDASIIWDEDKGKAVFENLDISFGAAKLNELADVSLKNPLVDGQSLVYDYASKKFVNKNIQGPGGGVLLESWESYVEGGMSGYGLSADLGYELHSQVDGLDSLLDEINGTPIAMIDSINGEII